MDTNELNQNDDHPTDSNQQQEEQRKKKCHGNRKDQRFRKKCRARQMKPETIEKLLKNRKQFNMKTEMKKKKKQQQQKKQKKNEKYNSTNNNSRNNRVPDTTTDRKKDVLNLTTMTNSNKRKRDASIQTLTSNSVPLKSTSSISITQPPPKKMMTNENKPVIDRSMPVTDDHMDINYRRPRYLKRPSSTLFQMLNKRLNYTLNKKIEQRFIYTRLELLDQHCYLDTNLQLWQSYLDIGLPQNQWPCQIKLTEQSKLCPIAKLTLDQLDSCLNKFVNCQRKYLKKRNNGQLNKFRDK
ncbi:unnamed protein product [Adineta ricciae]|uniref:Uncharacterized protein n=1 Tax=Adineta ricciae TaxID=249248 RepID=A0A815DHK7_ADIRI|nr:unnamed protein product [Adineta ricciae]